MTGAECDESPELLSEQSVSEGPPVAVADQDQDALSNDADELRTQIAQTRAELGDTVEALAAKADLTGRVKDKLTLSKEHVTERAQLAKTKAADVAGKITESLPDPAQRAVGEVTNKARQRPWAPIAAAVAILLLSIRRRAKRRKR